MRKRLLPCCVALALVAQACGTNDTTPVHVTIRKGSNFREAADFQEVLGEIARDDIIGEAHAIAKKH